MKINNESFVYTMFVFLNSDNEHEIFLGVTGY